MNTAFELERQKNVVSTCVAAFRPVTARIMAGCYDVVLALTILINATYERQDLQCVLDLLTGETLTMQIFKAQRPACIDQVEIRDPSLNV